MSFFDFWTSPSSASSLAENACRKLRYRGFYLSVRWSAHMTTRYNVNFTWFKVLVTALWVKFSQWGELQMLLAKVLSVHDWVPHQLWKPSELTQRTQSASHVTLKTVGLSLACQKPTSATQHVWKSPILLSIQSLIMCQLVQWPFLVDCYICLYFCSLMGLEGFDWAFIEITGTWKRKHLIIDGRRRYMKRSDEHQNEQHVARDVMFCIHVSFSTQL